MEKFTLIGAITYGVISVICFWIGWFIRGLTDKKIIEHLENQIMEISEKLWNKEK